MREVGFRRLHPEARLPERAHPGDAGFDLHATEAVTVPPGGRAAVPCGFAMALPEGTAGLVLPRSGLALRSGVTVLNAPGLIDSGYRGEVMAILVNHDSDDAFTVSPGDRIAQLVIVDLPAVAFVEVAELPESQRGEGGFGSTGVAG
ncbi:MAG: dUTP diphosphatase [Actinomycetota bacterium]